MDAPNTRTAMDRSLPGLTVVKQDTISDSSLSMRGSRFATQQFPVMSARGAACVADRRAGFEVERDCPEFS
jgi:hypothetical protein